jgi:hypothetical protein
MVAAARTMHVSRSTGNGSFLDISFSSNKYNA